MPKLFTVENVDLTKQMLELRVSEEAAETFSLAEGEWRATMTDEQVALWLGAHNTGSRPEGRP